MMIKIVENLCDELWSERHVDHFSIHIRIPEKRRIGDMTEDEKAKDRAAHNTNHKRIIENMTEDEKKVVKPVMFQVYYPKFDFIKTVQHPTVRG